MARAIISIDHPALQAIPLKTAGVANAPREQLNRFSGKQELALFIRDTTSEAELLALVKMFQTKAQELGYKGSMVKRLWEPRSSRDTVIVLTAQR
jgi:hypothetical protein